MSQPYWLVSLPIQGSKDTTWRLMQDKLHKASYDVHYYKLHVPELRVGTLDSLLALSDDLMKASSYVESVAAKIRRQIEELERTSGTTAPLNVDGVAVDAYMTRFQWDEAKHPLMSPLKETVDDIHEAVAKLEDDLKVRSSEYSSVRSQLSAINRKTGGSMLARDLADVVKSDDIIVSEHMTTLLVVVSKFSEREWYNTYETLTNFVVPQSSKKLAEDNEYILVTVTLFKRVADAFRTTARERGFQVREYDHDPTSVEQKKGDQQRLAGSQAAMAAALLQWCHVSYGEVYSAWMHISVIRLFTETILRYGLPPTYLAALIVPSSKTEKRIRDALDNMCASDHSGHWKSSDSDASMAGLMGGDTDLHPYVSVTMNVAL